MLLYAYTVKDAKAGTYGAPFFAANDAIATRSFLQAAADPNTTINAYPEDFSLFKVASFNDESAELKPRDPEFLTNAIVKQEINETEKE